MLVRDVAFTGPLDLRRTLSPLSHGPLDPTIRFGPGGAIRATNTPNGPATLRLRPRPGAVEATAWGPGSEWVLGGVDDLLGLDADNEDFRSHHPILRELHRRMIGWRQGRSHAVTEILVPTILGQKVTSNEAHRSYARLVHRYGSPAPGPGSLHVPPTPDTLAGLPYHSFHPLGIERKRADLVRAVCARASRLEALDGSAGDEAERKLRSLPGIGPWTAGHVRQIALGDPDVAITGDYHFPGIVGWVLDGDGDADDARMTELLEPYRGHRTRAQRLIVAAGIRPPARGAKRPLRAIEAI